MKRIVVGITGASGSIYAVRLLEALIRFEVEIHLLFSGTAGKVMQYETGIDISNLAGMLTEGIAEKKFPSIIAAHENSNLFAPVASGSFHTDGMIIIPCSMSCAGRIASCSGSLLLERAADVTLKEGRKLCLAVRETPLSLVHLETLAALARSGAVVFPAMPSFYGKPATVDDIVNSFVSRVLDSFGFRDENFIEWGG